MKLLLCGGGSGDKTVLTNQIFNQIIDNSKPILYIPLARSHERYPSCFEWMQNELKAVNFSELVMVNSSQELASKDFSDYAAIFIGGGNTYKLLKELKETAAFEKLINYVNNGGIVYGGSAGSIIFGKSIDACNYMDANEVELNDTTGLNLIFGASYTAHYTNKNEEKTNLATNYLDEYSHNEPVLAIPEEDTLYINDNLIKVIGTKNYYVFNNGVRTEMAPNIEYDKESFVKILNS
jgi:dipeptidase E